MYQYNTIITTLTGRDDAEHGGALLRSENIGDHGVKNGDGHVWVGEALDAVRQEDKRYDSCCVCMHVCVCVRVGNGSVWQDFLGTGAYS